MYNESYLKPDSKLEMINSVDKCVNDMNQSFLENLIARESNAFIDGIWGMIYEKGYVAGEEEGALKEYFENLSDSEKLQVMAVVQSMDNGKVTGFDAREMVVSILFKN